MTTPIPEHLLKTRRGEPVTFLEAISEALFEEMERDGEVFLLGEDIGVYGGAFKVTRDFLSYFGESRVIDTPIAEGGFTGAAAGAGMPSRAESVGATSEGCTTRCILAASIVDPLNIIGTWVS